jgi:hypothetical protein
VVLLDSCVAVAYGDVSNSEMYYDSGYGSNYAASHTGRAVQPSGIFVFSDAICSMAACPKARHARTVHARTYVLLHFEVHVST